jgi:hypothetical protein
MERVRERESERESEMGELNDLELESVYSMEIRIHKRESEVEAQRT